MNTRSEAERHQPHHRETVMQVEKDQRGWVQLTAIQSDM
jgi:hypothetical protein